MQESYEEVLKKIGMVQTILNAGTGDRLKLSQELMRLKRNLSKYPEHKERLNKTNKERNDEE